LRQRPDRLDGRQVGHVEVALGGADHRVRLLQDGYVELLLAAEVVVDHALGGARELGDLVHPRSRVAAPGELPLGDLEDLRLGAVGVAPAFTGDWLRGHGTPRDGEDESPHPMTARPAARPAARTRWRRRTRRSRRSARPARGTPGLP